VAARCPVPVPVVAFVTLDGPVVAAGCLAGHLTLPLGFRLTLSLSLYLVRGLALVVSHGRARCAGLPFVCAAHVKPPPLSLAESHWLAAMVLAGRYRFPLPGGEYLIRWRPYPIRPARLTFEPA
jgi:hypothetical protein